MPATSLADLFDFETHFADALKLILAGNGLTLLAAHDVDTVATPFVEIKFESSGRVDDTLVLRPDTSDYYHPHYAGVITLTLATRAGDPAQNHGTLRGTLRNEMSYLTRSITSTELPYYSIVEIRETQTQTAVDPDNDRLLTLLTFAVDFLINPDAFPA